MAFYTQVINDRTTSGKGNIHYLINACLDSGYLYPGDYGFEIQEKKLVPFPGGYKGKSVDEVNEFYAKKENHNTVLSITSTGSKEIPFTSLSYNRINLEMDYYFRTNNGTKNIAAEFLLSDKVSPFENKEIAIYNWQLKQKFSFSRFLGWSVDEVLFENTPFGAMAAVTTDTHYPKYIYSDVEGATTPIFLNKGIYYNPSIWKGEPILRTTFLYNYRQGDTTTFSEKFLPINEYAFWYYENIDDINTGVLGIGNVDNAKLNVTNLSNLGAMGGYIDREWLTRDRYRFPEGINHLTQYIGLPEHQSFKTIEASFLAKKCLDEYMDVWNEYHAYILSNGNRRAMYESERINALRSFGKVICIPKVCRLVKGGAFTACNPVVLILPPYVKIDAITRDHFFKTLRKIYYSHLEDLYTVMDAFVPPTNRTGSESKSDLNNAAATYFKSKNILLYPINMGIIPKEVEDEE